MKGTLATAKGEEVIQKARVGGFAEYVLVHESQLVKIHENFPMDVASLLACGVTTGFGAVVNRAKVPPLSSVVVIGAGGVGLNSVQGAVTCGANPIIAVDILDSKLAARQRLSGHSRRQRSQTDPVAAVKEITGGRGADYVFVTVGSSAALQQAFAMLARRGSAVMVGLAAGFRPCRSPSRPPSSPSPRRRSPAVSWAPSARRWTSRLSSPSIRAGRYKLDELIAGRYPFDRINEALESSAAGEALRNVIVFE